LNVGTYLLNIVATFPDILLAFFQCHHYCGVNYGNKIVPTPKKHDRKGECDRDEKPNIGNIEDNGVEFLWVTELLIKIPEEVGFNILNEAVPHKSN
jgi:hypothetical protein